MKKNFGQIIKSNKTLRRLYSVLGVIFLGAIGNGLWDYFLLDVFSWASKSFLTLISRTFTSYIDYLHRAIGAGPSEIFSLIPFAFILVIVCLYPWYALIRFIRILKEGRQHISGELDKDLDGKTQKEMLEEIGRYRKAAFTIGILLNLVVTLMYAELGFHMAYTVRAALFVERSIDILAPKLTTNQTLHLRAQYRSVNDANKFYQLEDSLKKLAQESGTELPRFQSVRIER